MNRKRTAIVLGSSGSVGTALLRELVHDDGFDAVITLTRRSLPAAVAMARAAGRKLVERLVPDMKPAPLAAATIDAASAVDGDLEGFSVLGIGAGTAKLTVQARER
jgi:NAD(P)-dependent dehydrogenase (short-subunit alcohol dehydrogenase family)